MKLRLVVNSAALFLLAAIAVSSYRLYSDSSRILEQNQALSAQISSVKQKLAEKEESTTFLATTTQNLVDQMSQKIEGFGRNFADLTRRISELEGQLKGQPPETEPSTTEVAPLAPEAVQPVGSFELSPELKEKATKVGYPESIQNYTLERLLDTANGLLPVSNASELSEDSKQTIHEYFEIFGAKVTLARARRTLAMNRSIEEFNEAGEYLEFPINASNQEMLTAVAAKNYQGGGVMVREYPDLAVKRHYHFPRSTHPIFIEANIDIEKARDEMVKEIYDYGKTLKKGG